MLVACTQVSGSEKVLTKQETLLIVPSIKQQLENDPKCLAYGEFSFEGNCAYRPDIPLH